MGKDGQINDEYNRLSSIFQDLDANEKIVVDGLLRQAAFMSVVLKDMQNYILEHGFIDSYQNGANQSGHKASATMSAYNSTLKNYTAVTKSLVSLVPRAKRVKVQDELRARMTELMDEETDEERAERYEQAAREAAELRRTYK